MKCYRLTTNFPSTEKFALVQQIRRAAFSVHLNLAEGVAENHRLKENASLKYPEVL
jgi:four helix bundle protein